MLGAAVREAAVSYTDYERWKSTPVGPEVDLSIVIPTYNEEWRIVPTIGAIASHVSGLGLAWELIIADDGSTDGRVDVVEDLGLVNLRVLRATANGGKGSAVRRGVLAAHGRYIVFVDADNSAPIEQVNGLLAKLEREGYDVAIASRISTDAAGHSRGVLRRAMSGGSRWLVRAFLRIGVKDTQCGFKGYTAPAAKRLHAAQTLDGFSFDLEILFLARKLGYRVAEVPIAFWESPGSKVRPVRDSVRFLRDIARIGLNNARGAYAHA